MVPAVSDPWNLDAMMQAAQASETLGYDAAFLHELHDPACKRAFIPLEPVGFYADATL